MSCLTNLNLRTGEFQSSCFYHVIYITVTGRRVVPWLIMVLPEDLVLLVVLISPRPPGLARCLGLDPREYYGVLGTWDNRYPKDTFDL